ncbi:MAG TPA: hypothetical protein VER39_01580 [Nocardioidaceae bacterium]|nr:hypothetical protein [Nocardioidaceae bacterium]
MEVPLGAGGVVLGVLGLLLEAVGLPVSLGLGALDVALGLAEGSVPPALLESSAHPPRPPAIASSTVRAASG